MGGLNKRKVNYRDRETEERERNNEQYDVTSLLP